MPSLCNKCSYAHAKCAHCVLNAVTHMQSVGVQKLPSNRLFRLSGKFMVCLIGRRASFCGLVVGAQLCFTVLHCASLCFTVLCPHTCQHQPAYTNLASTNLHTKAGTQLHAHTHIHTYTCTHTHAHTHAHPHTHPHTHTHTYTCTHTYIHAQMPSQLRQRFTSGASFGGGTATLTEAGFDLLSRLLVCVH